MSGTALSAMPSRTGIPFATGGMLVATAAVGFAVPTALSALPSRLGIPFAIGGMLVATAALGFEVGTGGAATLEYVRERGNKGYPLAAYDLPRRPANATAIRTPAQNLAHIRAVLKPTVTDLADVLGVSRQALYDWQSGKPVALENASRLSDLAGAADVFAVEGLTGSSEALHRTVRNGKNFFDLVREGGSADGTARSLIEILRSEFHQREVLKNRLAGRKRPSREAFDEIGAPMLDERS